MNLELPGNAARIVGPYRYRLDRLAMGRDNGKVATFVMLNPSTADASKDDPTIRRCLAFARAFDCARLVVVNLYAWRETTPRKLFFARACGHDIVGPENDAEIVRACSAPGRIIAAWGDHADRDRKRVEHVRDLMVGAGDVWMLGRCQGGQPRHPLMIMSGMDLARFA